MVLNIKITCDERNIQRQRKHDEETEYDFFKIHEKLVRSPACTPSALYANQARAGNYANLTVF
jgi:hypothetical protein